MWVLGEQPSTPEPSDGQQRTVMKVYLVVLWLQFTDMLNKSNLIIIYNINPRFSSRTYIPEVGLYYGLSNKV